MQALSCEGQQHHFLSWAWLCDGEEGTLSPCCQHKCMLHQWHPVINRPGAEGWSVWQSNCKAIRWWTRFLGAMGSQTPSAILARASWQSEDTTWTWWLSKIVSLSFKHFLPKLAIGTREKHPYFSNWNVWGSTWQCLEWLLTVCYFVLLEFTLLTLCLLLHKCSFRCGVVQKQPDSGTEPPTCKWMLKVQRKWTFIYILTRNLDHITCSIIQTDEVKTFI